MSNDLFRVLYGDRPELQENCCVYDVFGNSLSCSAASVAEFAKSIFTDHLWEHEPFQISSSKVLKNGGTDLHLRGQTRFGDNIDDEWFIVYALLKITEHFPVPKYHAMLW